MTLEIENQTGFKKPLTSRGVDAANETLAL